MYFVTISNKSYKLKDNLNNKINKMPSNDCLKKTKRLSVNSIVSERSMPHKCFHRKKKKYTLTEYIYIFQIMGEEKF